MITWAKMQLILIRVLIFGCLALSINCQTPESTTSNAAETSVPTSAAGGGVVASDSPTIPGGTDGSATLASVNQNSPGALRLKVPNPALGGFDLNQNISEAKNLLKVILSNPLMKQKFDSAMGHPGVQIGEWRAGCLSVDVKFPTIKLKPNLPISNPAVFQESSKDPKQIRINKFYGVKRDRFYVQNTGNGMISIKFEPDDPTSQATIRSEGWPDEYVLAKADIYWSLNNNHGAQHSIDGQPYALEIQFVHYAKSHNTLELSAKRKEGVIVTSILYEASGNQNPAIEPLAKAAAAVGFPNKKWRQMHGPLDIKTLFPLNLKHYTYHGQYINEPCTQNITWIVFRHPMAVSYAQLQRFREVRGNDAKRSSGVFLPLEDSTDTLENERQVKSVDEEIVLKVLPQVVLGNGTRLIINVSLLLKLFAALTINNLLFLNYNNFHVN